LIINFDEMEVINPPGTLICPHCGHPNDERAFFCSNCGAPIGSQAGRKTGGHREPPRYGDYYDREPRGNYFDGLPLLSLLVTIFGFFIAGFIGPLFGVVLAHISLRRINRRGDYSNRGLAIVSLVIGYLMLLLGLFILIALGALVGGALFHHGWNGGTWM
jgi:hypothetical protein